MTNRTFISFQNASALTAAADIALDAMARAAGSGDVNAASQVRGSVRWSNDMDCILAPKLLQF